MKNISKIAMGLLLASGCVTLLSCEDDHVMTLDAPQVILIDSITFDVTPTLPLPVGMDTTISYNVGPSEANDLTVVFTSSDESVASVDQTGKITAHKVGQATIMCRPPLDYKIYDAEATVLVDVIPELIKVEQINISLATPPSADGKIYVTDELQLQAEILPADHTYSRLVWSSSNEALATVDQEGNVVCNSDGDVSIYATATDRSGVRGEYKLHIDKYISAESLTIAPLDEPLRLFGNSVTLDVTYVPATATIGSVEWSSDNESVAVVRRGVVTPTGFGTANIIANCVETGYQASVRVTVEPGWFVFDASNQWNKWIIANYDTQIDYDERGDKVWRVHFQNPGAGKKWRGDFKIDCNNNNPFPMSLKNYPVLAIRMTKINGGNSTLDMVDLALGGGGNPNPKNGIDLGDGTQLLIYNVGAKYPDGDLMAFRVFQIKLADIPYENIDPANAYYDIYWIRTFKSEDEAKNFANEDVAKGKRGK